MDFENELAEMDKNEYRKLKRAITRNKSIVKGLSEKEKIKLLTGWIDGIKEERKKKAEEPEEEKEESYPWQEVEIESEKGKKIEEIKSQIFSDKKIREDEYGEIYEEEEKKGSPFKLIAGILLILLIAAACIAGTMFLLKDRGDVKFGNIKDLSIKENSTVSIEFKTKNADAIDVYGLPEGSKFINTTLTWTPTFEQAGTYKISATAYNNQSNKSQEFSIKVINVNRAPKILSASPAESVKVYTNKKTAFKVIAEDDDNENLTYLWQFSLFDRYSGESEINRTFTVPGSKKVKVKVCDKNDCIKYWWNIEAVEYIAPKKAAPVKTYIISEIRDEPKTDESSSKNILNTYIISEADESVQLITSGDGEKSDDSYIVNTYEVTEEDDESVVFIGEDSSNRLNSYTLP
jgi:hypothetical protein